MTHTESATLREQVQAIIDEAWSATPRWARPVIASSTDRSVSVVFEYGWDDFESIEEARRCLYHLAKVEREERRR